VTRQPDSTRKPAVCEWCGEPYTYKTSATSAIAVCGCNFDTPVAGEVPQSVSRTGEQLELEVK
jgi:hypothetical protein